MNLRSCQKKRVEFIVGQCRIRRNNLLSISTATRIIRCWMAVRG